MSPSFTAEDREITNPDTGHRYVVQVELPNRYHQFEDRRFPLVVCLDGLWTFGAVRDAFRLLPLSRELPEAVVVGVAHAEPDLKAVLPTRAVAFTPTSAAAPPQTGVRLPAEAVGQAARFRQFLRRDVIAPLRHTYRLNDDHTLVGHSFSALFGLDTLLHEPGDFSRWVLASPSVWWDSRVIFAREAAHAAGGGTARGRLFLSTGDEENDALGGHEDFYRQLSGRGHPELEIHWARFPGETHQSVISTALIRGLRLVFRD